MKQTTNAVTIAADDVAALIAEEYDDVGEDVRAAVLAAIIERGDTPDAGLVESLPVTVRAWDDGSSEQVDVDHGDDYEDAAKKLWDGADYGDGDYRVTVSWEATDAAGDDIDSGSFVVEGHTAEPECPDGEHDWTSEGEGGCDDNPGAWSLGGTSMTFHSHCRTCGLHRVETTTGPQHNPGECDTTEYRQMGDEEIAFHRDNGTMD